MRPEGKNRSTDRVKRARIIGLCEAGFSHSEIARRLGLSRHTVVKWCTRFAENGHLEDAARSGRPPKQTRAFIKAVERALRGRRGTSVRKVQAKLKAQGTVVSRMTVSRAAHAAELRPYSCRIKPILSAAHQRRRRLFARSERDRDWTRVIAADEATFYLCDTPNRRHDLVWVRKGDPIPPILKGKAATKWSLFGAIASSGRVALAVFDERFTKETYVEIMANELLPGADVAFPSDDWAYLHDRSPQHSSKVAQAWLDAYVPEHFSDSWPGNSPDLNPMENLWSVLRDRTLLRSPTTKDGLRTAIHAAWRSIDSNYTATLFSSMPNRLRDVIKAKGGHTKY